MGRLPLPIQLSICIIVFYRSEKFIKLCLKQFLQRVGFLICFFINIPWFSFLLFHFSVTHNLSHSFSKFFLFIPLSLNILNQSISSSLYLPTSLLKNIGVVITNVPQYPCCHRSNQLIFAFINEVLGHLSHELLHSHHKQEKQVYSLNDRKRPIRGCIEISGCCM